MIKRISKVEDLVKLPDLMHKELGEVCWWRGHSDLSWQLIPRIYRINEKYQKGLSYESNILNWFKSEAPLRHQNTPGDNDVFGWLTLAQHYRLPTRLLDWSQSVLIAAYFAVSDSEDKDGALWCLQPNTLNNHIYGNHGLFSQSETTDVAGMAFEPMYNIVSQLGELDHNENSRKVKDYIERFKVCAVVPFHTDIRMLLQMARFTIHALPYRIEEDAASKDYLKMFVIPKEKKASIKRSLELLGIQKHTVFSDLENLASYLETHDFSYLDNVITQQLFGQNNQEVEKA